MGRFGHENGPFWMLVGAVLVVFFFHWGRFGLRGPFSTIIGAVLAMGRFGRFPLRRAPCIIGFALKGPPKLGVGVILGVGAKTFGRKVFPP